MAMQLSDLLTELREGILHDMSDQVAGASDYLWTDARLIRYIDEAHRRFARRSLCINDNTSSITKITTVNAQASYPLDPSIIAVRSVRMAGDNQDLPRAGHDPLNTYHTPDPMFFDASTLEALPPGKALAFTTDESVLANANGSFQAINLDPVPSDRDALRQHRRAASRDPPAAHDVHLSKHGSLPGNPGGEPSRHAGLGSVSCPSQR